MRPLLMVLALGSAGVPLAAQTMQLEIVAVRAPGDLGSLSELPRLRGCGRVEQRLGSLRGSGTVRYTLTEAGRPDTAGLEVLTTHRLSRQGLRSAAARLLGDCRFEPARQAGVSVPVVVEQRIAFTTRTLPATAPLTPRLAGDAPTASVRSALESLEVEELPGIIGCGRLPTRERGDLVVRYVVGTDGRAEPGSAEPVEASNPRIGRYAEAFAGACRFTPGRLFGRRVAVQVQQEFSVR